MASGQETEHGWQAGIRVDGEPVQDEATAKAALVACGLWREDCNEPEVEDAEFGLWVVSVPYPQNKVLYNTGSLSEASAADRVPYYEVDIECDSL